MTSVDFGALRADTPSCEKLLHFNNAGSSLMPQPVYKAVIDHLALEQEIGGYEAANKALPQTDQMYALFGQLLDANANEISYVENATRAWDMAFYSLPLKKGDRILTHQSEYGSNYLAFLQLKKTRGVEIDLVPSAAAGQIDTEALEQMIGPRSKLIALTHVPTQGGLVNPAAEVGRIARKHGLIYLLDACQSVGQMPVSVKKIGCHILSGTGRKFLRGPRGTGFLYVQQELLEQLEPPFIDIRAATWTTPDSYELRNNGLRFENWESYIAGRVGLTEAVRYALAIGMENIYPRIQALADSLRKKLAEIPFVKIHDLGDELCGIVTFTKEDEAPLDIVTRLRAQRMNASVSPMTSSRLDLGSRDLTAVVRASVHYFNTEDEISKFCNAVAYA